MNDVWFKEKFLSHEDENEESVEGEGLRECLKELPEINFCLDGKVFIETGRLGKKNKKEISEVICYLEIIDFHDVCVSKRSDDIYFTDDRDLFSSPQNLLVSKVKNGRSSFVPFAKLNSPILALPIV